MNYHMNRVAVIGAGVMGASIAAHIAGTGTPVLLLDIVPKALTQEDAAKGLTIESAAFRNKFSIAGKEKILNPKSRAIFHKSFGALIAVGNLEDDLEQLKTCDWIVEVVLEELAVKQQLFEKIRPYLKENAIVSSNTSGISIRAIAARFDAKFKAQFLGTHFFNPPRYMKLFEMIPLAETNPEIIEFMAAYATKTLGKGVVYAKDTPNFIANRIGTQANLAVMRLAEKYDYSISKADLLTGEAIGRPKSATFRTIDMVGLDILLHVAGNVTSNLDSAFEAEAYAVPQYVSRLETLGYYGDKTGGGFYKKQSSEKGVQKMVWDRKTESYVPNTRDAISALDAVKSMSTIREKIKALVWGQSPVNQFIWDVIKSNLLYSAHCVPEITESVFEIDNGMKWGFNWQLGPFEIWDAIGVKQSVARMTEEGDSVPKWVLDRIQQGKENFYESDSIKRPNLVLEDAGNHVIKENEGAKCVDLGDGVLGLTFKTKGNTVNREVIQMIYDTVALLEESDYKGLILATAYKNFSAGANLQMIGELAQAQKWSELERLIYDFQHANLAMKHCTKPVVSASRGMTLGGGAEMAIHAHQQVAHAETYMGLVELGVGLIPGGGGCKELLFRTMDGGERAPLAERIRAVQKLWRTIAMAKVSSSAHDAKAMGFLRSTDLINMNLDDQLSEAKKAVLARAEKPTRDLHQNAVKVTGKSGFAAIQLELIQMTGGGFVSEYDGFLAEKVAYVLTGGNVIRDTMVSEEQLLDLEREIFLGLCGEAKTQERIHHMLTKGKPLRN